jgi:hypothetical protein
MRLALLGIVMCSAFCIAQDQVPTISTGTGLLETCTRVNSVTRRADNFDEWASDQIHTSMAFAACFGFIEAVQQMGSLGDENSLFCPPDGVTYGQSKRIVLKYLNDHPEELHLPSTFLVSEAFRGAFPCAVKKPTKPPATGH